MVLVTETVVIVGVNGHQEHIVTAAVMLFDTPCLDPREVAVMLQLSISFGEGLS